LSRLPSGVHRGVRGVGPGRDARRRVSHPCAADRAHQGRDHQAGHQPRRRLRGDALVLRAVARRLRLPPLARGPAAQEGIRRGGCPRSDSLRYARAGMKLGTLLLRNAAIGLTQLEAALRNQVLYGGRLGTNLVELGFIDLELLSSYLAELTGFPIA